MGCEGGRHTPHWEPSDAVDAVAVLLPVQSIATMRPASLPLFSDKARWVLNMVLKGIHVPHGAQEGCPACGVGDTK